MDVLEELLKTLEDIYEKREEETANKNNEANKDNDIISYYEEILRNKNPGSHNLSSKERDDLRAYVAKVYKNYFDMDKFDKIFYPPIEPC